MRQHITRRVAILLATVALALSVPLAVFASHQFTDVPNSNPFHGDIDALVDSGVTFGCGGGRYCPKANVTREQMAAFMNRLGALAPGTTPVVNATRLDGIDSTHILPGGALASGSTVRGTYAVEYTATLAGNRGISPIPFGFTLGATPTEHFIPVGGVPPAACPGSASSPQAQAGHLCVYESFETNVAFSCITSVGTYLCDQADRFGATLYTEAAGPGQVSSVGSWAVRAPLGFTAEEPAAGPSCTTAPKC
jgi:hypothetical protein